MDHNETKKALECCVAETEDACVLCPLHDERWCVSIRNNATLDLINRYEAEIERLENSLAISKKETKRYVANYETIKADAVKEFAEKLKQCMDTYADDWCWIEMSQISFEEMVDLLVKEFRRVKKHD